jgi:hypothetical protein
MSDLHKVIRRLLERADLPQAERDELTEAVNQDEHPTRRPNDDTVDKQPQRKVATDGR